MSGKRIENEEQYQNSLKWLVQKSIELGDPLLEGEAREKLQANYDYVSARVEQYRRGELANKFPGLKQQYDKIGFKYNKPEPAAVPAAVAEETMPQPQEPAPQREEKSRKSVFSNFFD